MRVYISVDIEGVAGVVHMDQTHGTGSDFGLARGWMTDEANAAALGAFDAGATDVLINDSHGDMRNLLFDRLDPRVQVLSGSFKPYSMAEGADLSAAAAVFVGYHAGMGAKAGILDHTYAGACIAEIRVAGRVVNEAALNALVLGTYRTPVALVTGDEAAVREVEELLPGTRTLAVKWAVTRYAARSLHPIEACRRIREATREALSAALPAPYTLPSADVEVRWLNSGLADAAEIMPGVRRIDGVRTRYEANDFLTMFRGLMAMQRLAAASIPSVRR